MFKSKKRPPYIYVSFYSKQLLFYAYPKRTKERASLNVNKSDGHGNFFRTVTISNIDDFTYI